MIEITSTLTEPDPPLLDAHLDEDLFEPEVEEKKKSCVCVEIHGYSECSNKCMYCKEWCLYTPKEDNEGHHYCGYHKCCSKDGKTDFNLIACPGCGYCKHHLCQCWTCKKCKGKFDHGNQEIYCTSCEACKGDECGCICPKSQYGTSAKPPWELRGTVPKIDRDRSLSTTYEEQWEFTPKEHDPTRGCAEFYLLELVENAVGPGWSEVRDAVEIVPLREQAKSMRNELVTVWDHVFRKYVAMACWGESRYHVAMGGAKGGVKYKNVSVFTSKEHDRSRAWVVAKEIEDQVGTPQVYYDLYELFSEMDGKCYGGKKWADSMRLLADRCAEVIPADIFVDRIFSMQHNGGSLLNKVTWGIKNSRRWNVDAIRMHVGPAHSNNPPDFDTLCSIARPEVVDLFEGYVSKSDRIRRRLRLEPLVDEAKAKRRFWATVPVHVKELARRDRGAALDEYFNWQEEVRRDPSKKAEVELVELVESPEPPCDCDDCATDECGTCCYDECKCCEVCDDYPCCCEDYEEEEDI